MPSILNRYVFRETIATWAAVTLVLLLILLTEQFARVLGDAAGAKLPKDAIVSVMLLGSVQYLTILMPVSIFLSIMLALARFYRDSEMAAIMAGGIGPASLFKPLFVIALVLAAGATWLSLDIAPAARRAIQEVAWEARKNVSLNMVEAGRFIPLGTRNAVIYAESVDESGRLNNVFVQVREEEQVQVIVAAEAVQRNDVDTGDKVLTFLNGKRYEGVPGEGEFMVISFAEHGIPYKSKSAKPLRFNLDAMTLSELVGQDPDEASAEIQWRLSVPLTLLVLTVLAVPLSRTRPRQGRYSNVAAGILAYIIYANLLAAAKVWVEQGSSPKLLGIWWVHLVFLAIAIAMLVNQHGGWRRMRAAWLKRRAMNGAGEAA